MKGKKRKEQPVSLGPSHNDCSWLSFSNPSISPRPRELTLRDQTHAPAASHIGTKKRREIKAAKSKRLVVKLLLPPLFNFWCKMRRPLLRSRPSIRAKLQI